MSEQAGGEGATARLIRSDGLVRMVRGSLASANDNRRTERGAVSLARAVVTTAGAAARRAPLSASDPLARRPAAPPDPAWGRATTWLGQNLALWSAGLGAACRLPPVAVGLALWRAWSEVGLTGMATCASVAASIAELAALALAGALGAAAPRRRSPDPG
jgi:hypothetical protein